MTIVDSAFSDKFRKKIIPVFFHIFWHFSMFICRLLISFHIYDNVEQEQPKFKPFHVFITKLRCTYTLWVPSYILKKLEIMTQDLQPHSKSYIPMELQKVFSLFDN